jgi:hypothetical protein
MSNNNPLSVPKTSSIEREGGYSGSLIQHFCDLGAEWRCLMESRTGAIFHSQPANQRIFAHFRNFRF